ncbi:hypothetical protein M3226_15085 [Neobacillus cucumis]|uniref:hypothetical protein n=1 Tax=Neobacillus cucumis TaxID=1740721 RepID=UPI00203A4743|nr:hypothetical protein [Neobacillus cucumis]MCM3727008.1 hypothetical protein [Neobacillus cucumis]
MIDDKTPLNHDSMEDRIEEIIKNEKIKLDALEKKLKDLMYKLEKYEKRMNKNDKSRFLLTCNRYHGKNTGGNIFLLST